MGDRARSMPASTLDIIKRLYSDFMEKDLQGVAKQVAYNVLFAIGPLLIFITALAGFIVQRVNADQPNPVVPLTSWLEQQLPSDAASVLREPVQSALTTSPAFLISFGGLFALWGAKNAIGIVMTGLNVAYGTDESRNWFVRQGTAIALTIAFGLGLAVVSLLFVFGTSIGADMLQSLGLPAGWVGTSLLLRWPLMFAFVIVAVTVMHSFGPDLDRPFRWFLPGAIASVVLWALALLALRLYFAYAGGMGDAYGAFGAMLAFIFFLYVMGMVTLLGGSINGAIHQDDPEVSAVDTTTSAAEPG
jgi:membrane protein